MGWELPDDPNPPDTICVQLQVPNDPHYVAAFWGAILDLSAGFNWANDSAHTAVLAARRMRQMYLEAQLSNCPVAPTTGRGGYYRRGNVFQQPTSDPCLLQAQCPDGTWDTIFDASKCNPNPAPGGGQGPTGPGQCNKYTLNFPCGVMTPLPFVVNTGDTIEVLRITGAGTDNGGLGWRCPDGEIYVIGGCDGFTTTVPADPLNTAPHMSILFLLNGAYHEATGTFTVPSGIVNLPISVLANTAATGPFGGSYAMQVQFCNNSTPPATSWCHFIDFTVAPQGFSPLQLGDGGGGLTPYAQWVGGSGWQAVYKLQDMIPQYQWGFMIVLDLGLTPTLPWTVEAEGHTASVIGVGGSLTVGVIDSPATSALYGTFVNSATMTANVAYDYTLTLSGVNKRYLYVLANDYALASIPSPEFTLTSLKISGSGPNPFGSSNC